MSEPQAAAEGGTAWWAKFTLIGGVVAALLLIMGPLGYRLGVLGVQGAVLMAPGMATALAMITLLFALVAVFLTLSRGLTEERMPVLVGGVLAVAILINVGTQFSRAQSVPRIHDITTAPQDPPRFLELVDKRGDASNSLEYDAETLADLTRQAYPEVRPVETNMSPDAAFARAEKLAEQLGWNLVASNPQAGRIEATDTTALYGFIDDVVIRVRPRNGGSVIDLRSVSRVGQSDLGTNAARIRAFIERF